MEKEGDKWRNEGNDVGENEREIVNGDLRERKREKWRIGGGWGMED